VGKHWGHWMNICNIFGETIHPKSKTWSEIRALPGPVGPEGSLRAPCGPKGPMVWALMGPYPAGRVPCPWPDPGPVSPAGPGSSVPGPDPGPASPAGPRSRIWTRVPSMDPGGNRPPCNFMIFENWLNQSQDPPFSGMTTLKRSPTVRSIK